MPTLLSNDFEESFISSCVFAIQGSKAYTDTMLTKDPANENALLLGWYPETLRWEIILSLPREFAHVVCQIHKGLGG
jgi:hypothetical protein